MAYASKKNTQKQKQHINLCVYNAASVLHPSHDRKEPIKNKFLVDFLHWIDALESILL